MKKFLTIIFLIQFTVTVGCVGKHIDEGKRITKTFEIKEFTKLDVSDAFKIIVNVGKDASLKITAGENIIPYINVKNIGDKLAIDFKDNLQNIGEVLVEITVKELKNVALSGACKIKIYGISTESFVLDMSGACNGEISGQVKELEVDLSGATNLDASKLISESVEIEVSGASKADIYASKSVNAEASGASNITILGDPKEVETDVTGASNIKSK